MVLYPILLSQSWSTIVPNFMLVSGIAQSGQNLALSRLAIMVKFKDFLRPLSVFQVLFKANLIFKDFSRQSCIFKYFSSMCEP